jgi:O-antigen biosynthesis protein
MEFTGEFFIPHDAQHDRAGNVELEIEHKQRYLSILDMADGKTVLDIASGEGYGTHILASKAKQVFGVDINPDLVEHAAGKYQGENIRFFHGSVTQIPLGPDSVDLIVSFETLEHVSEEMQQQFLLEVKRVLKRAGVFIVSTPDKKNYTDRYDYHNKFHVHELYQSDLERLLKTHFGHVTLYEQGREVVNLILHKEDYILQRPVPLMPVNNSFRFEGKYLIGICSDRQEAIRRSVASMVPESDKSYFDLIDRILQLQKEVVELGSWGKKSASELDLSNARILQLQEEVRALHAGIEQRHLEAENLADQLQTVSEEKAFAEKKLQVAGEDIIFYNEIIKRTQTDLAQARHDTFLKETEWEVIKQQAGQGPIHFSGIEKLTEEITRLIREISKKDPGGTMDPAPKVESNPDPGAGQAQANGLQEQIAKLQEELQWYKRTYEERSILGVVKQKITAKFHK